MATQLRPLTPLDPSTAEFDRSTADSPPERHAGLQDWLRIIAEDMDALGQLAVTIDHFKARAATTPQARTDTDS